ncbi:MAG: exodeoxyribonuclease VII large subunit [Eubacteriales bacterium]
MKNIFSVSQVNAYIKNLFVQDFVVNDIWIKGEISNYKLHNSGHIYFTLKDGTACISCVLFNRYKHLIPNRVEDGMNIIARGYISVYERTGQYQLYVSQIRLEGIGELFQKFEELKITLEEKGYFKQEYKKNIPKYPKKVGIVTSSTGAAINDIINVSKRRNPYIQLVLYSSIVQGEKAALSIVKGIQELDCMEDIDIIIVGRGGGSIEDLWGFNELIVAEAIFNATKPIISAVGHETDFTISDFVSDLRAPTPSAAAELAVPSIEILDDLIKQYKYKLNNSLYRKFDELKNQLKHIQLRVNYVNPIYKIQEHQQFLIDLENRMKVALNNKVKDYNYRVKLLNDKIKALSPISRLQKGYAFVSDTKGNIIKSIEQVENQQPLILQLLDGKIEVKVKNKINRRWEDDDG